MAELVFLFDVDNTLLDNDRVRADLSAHLEQAHGAPMRDRYWALFEQLRGELGYADYLGALERYRVEDIHNPGLFATALWLIDYPFADRVFPGALAAVRHVAKWGETVILSDGDAVFQPLKIARSGLLQAFGGRALVYIHKEQELADIERQRPARHYVVVDDKLQILTAIKAAWRERVTSVFVKQGHYAADVAAIGKLPRADVEIEHISDLQDIDFARRAG